MDDNQIQNQPMAPPPGKACALALAIVHLGRTRQALLSDRSGRDARIVQARGHIDLGQRLLERALNDNLPNYVDIPLDNVSGFGPDPSRSPPSHFSTPLRSRSVPSVRENSPGNEQRGRRSLTPPPNPRGQRSPATNQGRANWGPPTSGRNYFAHRPFLKCPRCSALIQTLLKMSLTHVSHLEETDIAVRARFFRENQLLDNGDELKCPHCLGVVDLQLKLCHGVNDLFRISVALVQPNSTPRCSAVMNSPPSNAVVRPPPPPRPTSAVARIPPPANVARPRRPVELDRVVSNMLCPACRTPFYAQLEIGTAYLDTVETEVSFRPGLSEDGRKVKCPRCLNSAVLRPILGNGANNSFRLAISLTANEQQRQATPMSPNLIDLGSTPPPRSPGVPIGVRPLSPPNFFRSCARPSN